MYTNGLKDRFGSPLVSQRDLEPTIDTINGRLTSTETNLEDVNFNINGLTTDLDDVTKEMFKLKNQLDTEYVTVGKLDDVYNRVDTEIVKGLKERFTEYSNSVFPIATDGTSNAYVSSFRFGYKHCPKGLIKKVSTYARDKNNATHASKTEGCYLIAKVYNKADSSLVREQTSKNKIVVVERTNSNEFIFNTWEFDGILSPNENEVIKFVPSPDGKTQVSGYYMGMLVDTTHTHVDCRCGGDDDFVNNPISSGNKYLGLCKFEGDFYKDKKQTQELEYFEKDFLKTLYTVSTSNQQIWDNNVNNETVGQGQCKAFTLVRPYIRNGKYSEVRWTSQGNSNVTVYCRITTRDLNGNDVQTVVSHNTENFAAAGLKSFRFNEEFEINDNIGSVLFETSTDGINPSSTAQWRIRIIGNDTKPDTDGGEMAANSPYTCQVIFWGKKAQLGGDILTKTRADELYAAKDGIVTTSYDWTPDLQNNIKLEVSSYSFPVNGWLVSRDWQYLAGHDEIRINDLPVGQVNPEGNFSLLVKKDDVLTVGDDNGTATFWFLPCKSEENDYRVTHTQYDIWRGAVTTDAQGNTVVQNMHCPDASGWSSTVRSNTITSVQDEVAYADDTFLCNIQTSEIVNGNNLMTNQSGSIINWNSDLQRLKTGKNLFQYCHYLAEFAGDLSSLEDGTGMFGACDYLVLLDTKLPSLTKGDLMFSGCEKLETFEIELPSLTDGTYMFHNCGLTSWELDMPKLTNGYAMFHYCVELASFSGDLPSLTFASDMFKYCEKLTSFQGDLSSLEYGGSMFEYSKLASFNGDMPKLIDGERMFCEAPLESFSGDLSSLEEGDWMFYGTSLASFNVDLPKMTYSFYMFCMCGELKDFKGDLSSLTNGDEMFYLCEKLTSFDSNLSSLTNGRYMFEYASELSHFDADLSSLDDGHAMFGGCNLDAASVEKILTTIPTYSSGSRELHLTMSNAGCAKAAEILGIATGKTIPSWSGLWGSWYSSSYKGWTVKLTCNEGVYRV